MKMFYCPIVAAAVLLCCNRNIYAAAPPTPSVAEARQIVLSYMTQMATQQWVCQTFMDFTRARPYTKTLTYQPGTRYIGIPYVSNHRGVELFRHNLDANKVYLGPTNYAHCLGVSCAPAIKVAYRNVSPTLTFTGTPNILPHARKGIVAVGNYQWEVDTPANATLTKDIIAASGTNAILEAYALLQPADTIAARTLSGTNIFGHARLVSSAPEVVRDSKGKINTRESWLRVTEQCGSFNKDVDYNTTWRVNKKYTFADLIAKHYVPLTLEEFKTGKLVPAEITVTGLTPAEKIPTQNKLQGEVSSNFLINQVDATIYDADGRIASHGRSCPESRQFDLAAISFDKDVTKLPAGAYRFVLTVKIGYGDSVQADYTFTK
ncbi:MAG: hypothetical protein FJ395_08440 [Verrucomicrobia bacterium]|nr:hypothetical protein [Verrucomicrobiota bacterium]